MPTMRRPRFRRSSSRFSIPDYIMPLPPSPTQMSLRSRDTGFPEPFCGSRNTSLPHPDAKLGPDACIGEEDVNPARAMVRYRMTFLARSGSLTSHQRDTSTSSSYEEGGAISALGRLAISSLRAAELPERHDAESSDGVSSRSPDSPEHRGDDFEHRMLLDRRHGSLRGPRHHRRRSSLISRLIHWG